MKCPFCGALVPKGNKVCDRCHEEVDIPLDYFLKVVVLPMLCIAIALGLFFWWFVGWWPVG